MYTQGNVEIAVFTVNLKYFEPTDELVSRSEITANLKSSSNEKHVWQTGSRFKLTNLHASRFDGLVNSILVWIASGANQTLWIGKTV